MNKIDKFLRAYMIMTFITLVLVIAFIVFGLVSLGINAIIFQNSVETVESAESETTIEQETETETETVKILYEEIEMILTAYCPCEKCCGEYAHNRPKDENGNDIIVGSSGERLIDGVSVAVDPKVIPFGTELIIDGKTYIAQDCGGAIKGNRIDIFFDSHEKALNFGRQIKIVKVRL